MPPYFLSFRTALAVRACPAFAEALAERRGSRRESAFPSFPQPVPAVPPKHVLLTPPSEPLAREGRLTQAFGLCPTSRISAPLARNISAQRVMAGARSPRTDTFWDDTR